MLAIAGAPRPRCCCRRLSHRPASPRCLAGKAPRIGQMPGDRRRAANDERPEERKHEVADGVKGGTGSSRPLLVRSMLLVRSREAGVGLLLAAILLIVGA